MPHSTDCEYCVRYDKAMKGVQVQGGSVNLKTKILFAIVIISIAYNFGMYHMFQDKLTKATSNRQRNYMATTPAASLTRTSAVPSIIPRKKNLDELDKEQQNLLISGKAAPVGKGEESRLGLVGKLLHGASKLFVKGESNESSNEFDGEGEISMKGPDDNEQVALQGPRLGTGQQGLGSNLPNGGAGVMGLPAMQEAMGVSAEGLQRKTADNGAQIIDLVKQPEKEYKPLPAGSQGLVNLRAVEPTTALAKEPELPVLNAFQFVKNGEIAQQIALKGMTLPPPQTRVSTLAYVLFKKQTASVPGKELQPAVAFQNIAPPISNNNVGYNLPGEPAVIPTQRASKINIPLSGQHQMAPVGQPQGPGQGAPPNSVSDNGIYVLPGQPVAPTKNAYGTVHGPVPPLNQNSEAFQMPSQPESQHSGNIQQPVQPESQHSGIIQQPVQPASQNSGIIQQPAQPESQNSGIIQMPAKPDSQNSGIIQQPAQLESQNSGIVQQPAQPESHNFGIVQQPAQPQSQNSGIIQQPALSESQHSGIVQKPAQPKSQHSGIIQQPAQLVQNSAVNDWQNGDKVEGGQRISVKVIDSSQDTSVNHLAREAVPERPGEEAPASNVVHTAGNVDNALQTNNDINEVKHQNIHPLLVNKASPEQLSLENRNISPVNNILIHNPQAPNEETHLVLKKRSIGEVKEERPEQKSTKGGVPTIDLVRNQGDPHNQVIQLIEGRQLVEAPVTQDPAMGISSTPFRPKVALEKLNYKQNKIILLYTPFFGNANWEIEPGDGVFRRLGCKVSNCAITNRLELEEHADALLFHDEDWGKEIPDVRHAVQRYVFFSLETSYKNQYPNNTGPHFFNWTMTYSHDSDIRAQYGAIIPRSSVAPPPDYLSRLKTKTRPVAWMVSNCFTRSQRETYVEELKLHIEVDVYGDCGPFRCTRDLAGGDRKCMNRVGTDYWFYLSFENALCEDYITEKYYMALAQDVVPIVRGAGNYNHVTPGKWFLNTDDFPSPKALAEKLHYLINHPSEYIEYFKDKEKYDIKPFYGIKSMPAWCDLCEKLYANEGPTVRNVKEWWDEGRCRWPSDLHPGFGGKLSNTARVNSGIQGQFSKAPPIPSTKSNKVDNSNNNN